MAGESKQIYQLTSGEFNGQSLVPFEVPNTDPSTSNEKPFLTKNASGNSISEFIAKAQMYATDLQTEDKTIIGAINELKEGGGGNANYVELTQAEYDLLTEEEKHNGKMYFITDGGSDGDSIGFVEESIPEIPERELPYYPSGEYSTLNTNDKHIVGAINEVNSEKANKSDVQRIATTNIEVTPEANSYVQPFTFYKEIDVTSYLSGKKIIGVLLMTGQTTDPLGYNYNEPMLRIYASKGNKVTVKLILIS